MFGLLAKFSRLQDLFRVYIIASKRDAVQVGVCRLVRQVGCFTTLGGWAADREPLQQSYHSLCERSSVAKSHVANYMICLSDRCAHCDAKTIC